MPELAADPSPENVSTLDRLVRSIDLAEGFTLFIARCNIPALRRELMNAATQQLAALDVEVVEVAFEDEPANVRDRLAAALQAANEHAAAPVPIALPTQVPHLAIAEPSTGYAVTAKHAVFVTGLESGIPYDQPNSRVLAELNLGRDLFPRDVPCPLVIWLPDYAVTAVARHAPDFWAWRSGVFEFTTVDADRGLAIQQIVRDGPGWMALYNLPLEAKLVRRRQLESLLDDYRDLPDEDRIAAERAEILSDLGSICEALLDSSCALTHYRQALPIYERLGDVRERAVTLGKIADVLQARGQLDEALRIRQEEQLPVYERLGDVRERAVTLGKIADVLQARGQLDEALRIRQEEELPTYERLGDVPNLIWGRYYMADNLLERNAPGDRAEALRLLRLALDDARAMRIPGVGQIEAILQAIG